MYLRFKGINYSIIESPNSQKSKYYSNIFVYIKTDVGGNLNEDNYVEFDLTGSSRALNFD